MLKNQVNNLSNRGTTEFQQKESHPRNRMTVFLGILTILVGVAACLMPQWTTLAVELLIGIVLVSVGAIEGIHIYQLKRQSRWGWRALDSLLALTVGGFMLAFPLQGVLTLTILLALFFFLSGGFTIMLALQLRAWNGWGWILTSGIVSLMLGLLVSLQWPEHAGMVAGILIGVDLIFSGWWLVWLGWDSVAMIGENGRPEL